MISRLMEVVPQESESDCAKPGKSRTLEHPKSNPTQTSSSWMKETTSYWKSCKIIISALARQNGETHFGRIAGIQLAFLFGWVEHFS